MREPGEFEGRCDRSKQYKNTCLEVPYNRPLIVRAYPEERSPLDPDDIRIPRATMCRECRALKEQFRPRPK